jgi:tRNA(Ile)-lysidine synthase
VTDRKRAAGTRIGPRAEPVADSELGRLFDVLASFRHIILAVSGGPDSMALMHLVSRWRALHEGDTLPDIEVATVDHGLRAESSDEARWVGARAREFGFRHKTLVWKGEKPLAGVEEAAREARYLLLAGYAAGRRAKRVAVVTAHTEDDQAETLLMRLARGSGIDGLSSMPSRRRLGEDSDVELVRPLLAIPKRRLVAALKAADIAWLEDPSNERLDFERARLRAAHENLAALGLTSDKLALSARRLARARAVLDQALKPLAATVDVHEGIFASIDLRTFADAAAELRVRLLMRVLRAFGGDAKPPRLAKVESLADALSASCADAANVAFTLGGCIIRASPRSIRVFREGDRGDLPQVEIEPGREVLWDGRFHVGIAAKKMLNDAGVSTSVTVRALGASAYATLRRRLPKSPHGPARALAALPSFWSGDRLIAVPQLAFDAIGAAGKAGGRGDLCNSRFVGWERTDT